MKNILALLIIFCSCTDSSSFRKNLVNDEFRKTWVHGASNKDGRYESIGNYFVFEDDGTFKVYYSLERYKAGVASPSITVDGPPISYSWSFGRDSTFKVGSHVFKVVKYNIDSIYMKVEGSKDNFLFTRYKEVK